MLVHSHMSSGILTYIYLGMYAALLHASGYLLSNLGPS